MALKLISLNIERSKHLEKVLPFLREQAADIVCIQEVIERDLPALSDAIGAAEYVYAPLIYHPAEVELALEGDVIFSRHPIVAKSLHYYKGSADAIKTMEISEAGNPIDAAAQQNCALILAEIEQGGEQFTIGTTHFTWTPRGEATDDQRADMRALLEILHSKEFVLCGDFNAPRGGEIFEMLATRYADAIPPHYKTSIDIALHRAGKDRPEELADKMVDGLFTTPAYRAQDVSLVNGVSDHMAIVATIEKGTALA